MLTEKSARGNYRVRVIINWSPVTVKLQHNQCGRGAELAASPRSMLGFHLGSTRRTELHVQPSPHAAGVAGWQNQGKLCECGKSQLRKGVQRRGRSSGMVLGDPMQFHLHVPAIHACPSLKAGCCSIYAVVGLYFRAPFLVHRGGQAEDAAFPSVLVALGLMFADAHLVAKFWSFIRACL